jgi:hypothetical protein
VINSKPLQPLNKTELLELLYKG